VLGLQRIFRRRVVSEVPPEKEVERVLKGWGDNYVDKHRDVDGCCQLQLAFYRALLRDTQVSQRSLFCLLSFFNLICCNFDRKCLGGSQVINFIEGFFELAPSSCCKGIIFLGNGLYALS
jgi:hypothetical protein